MAVERYKASAPTASEVRLYLEYCPLTGVLTWVVSSPRYWKGEQARSRTDRGYVRVGIGGKNFLGHRVAWLLHYGEWPPGDLDHINGVKDDNRIANLRIATPRQNQQNLPCHRKGKLPGVTRYERNTTKKWMARARLNGKRKTLGYYATESEAHAAYQAAIGEQT